MPDKASKILCSVHPKAPPPVFLDRFTSFPLVAGVILGSHFLPIPLCQFCTKLVISANEGWTRCQTTAAFITSLFSVPPYREATEGPARWATKCPLYIIGVTLSFAFQRAGHHFLIWHFIFLSVPDLNPASPEASQHAQLFRMVMFFTPWGQVWSFRLVLRVGVTEKIPFNVTMNCDVDGWRP